MLSYRRSVKISKAVSLPLQQLFDHYASPTSITERLQQHLCDAYDLRLFILSRSALQNRTTKMAQGAVKSKPKPAPTSKPKATKGAKVKKPKSNKADKLQKRYTAGMVSKTEKLLGERAGHLELIGKGKKGKKDEKHKGGSRKFG